ALYGADVVTLAAFGKTADRMSRGHRFMHDKAVWVSDADASVEAMRGAKVLVDADERRAAIVREVEAAAAQAGGTARITEDNLEQVNGLVEWPKAVLCGFEKAFLRVPQEALISTMEANQKFFPVLDAQGRITEAFVGIANIVSTNEAEVRKGYERVIRPRFADAAFFFDEDLKQGLSAMNAGLATVTYQQKLGSYADKVARIAQLARAIASALDDDADLAQVAALLCKADLQSRMVNEFPELQGIAGRYYAAHDAGLAELPTEARNAVAVAATTPVSRADFAERLAALQRFAELPEAAALAAANKRARNILKKVEGALPEAIDASKLVEPAERELHDALVAALADTDASLAARDYVAVLSRLAALRAPVDAFFDGVMVMAEDPAVRDNRLALLKALADRFAAVAAIEQLAT
ncbi:MAG: glycine--tRNA ligase subunit beta, partial [Lysobacteraceae bacterium]